MAGTKWVSAGGMTAGWPPSGVAGAVGASGGPPSGAAPIDRGLELRACLGLQKAHHQRGSKRAHRRQDNGLPRRAKRCQARCGGRAIYSEPPPSTIFPMHPPGLGYKSPHCIPRVSPPALTPRNRRSSRMTRQAYVGTRPRIAYLAVLSAAGLLACASPASTGNSGNGGSNGSGNGGSNNSGNGGSTNRGGSNGTGSGGSNSRQRRVEYSGNGGSVTTGSGGSEQRQRRLPHGRHDRRRRLEHERQRRLEHDGTGGSNTTAAAAPAAPSPAPTPPATTRPRTGASAASTGTAASGPARTAPSPAAPPASPRRTSRQPRKRAARTRSWAPSTTTTTRSRSWAST